jgi:hypothetical protein
MVVGAASTDGDFCCKSGISSNETCFLLLIGFMVDPSTGALEAELSTSADSGHDRFMLNLRHETSESSL